MLLTPGVWGLNPPAPGKLRARRTLPLNVEFSRIGIREQADPAHRRCTRACLSILVSSRWARDLAAAQWRSITSDSIAGKLTSMQVIRRHTACTAAGAAVACDAETTTHRLRTVQRRLGASQIMLNHCNSLIYTNTIITSA